MDSENQKQRELAEYVANRTSDAERDALIEWASELLKIRESNLPASKKSSEALRVTARSKIVKPTAKLIWGEVKRHAWDERSLSGRMGLGAAAVGVAVFGSQGAGIAALGTAIGVPLWVVLGGGGAFAGMLIEELTAKRKPEATYTVIDAEKDDGTG